MLRDVIDLETTFTELGESDELNAEIKELKISAQPKGLEHVKDEKQNEDALGSVEEKNDEEEEEDAINVSLAAMELSLTPHVLNILEDTDRKYTKLKELEKRRMKATFDKSKTFSAKDEIKTLF
jgi:RNA polymerase primary sigma factor